MKNLVIVFLIVAFILLVCLVAYFSRKTELDASPDASVLDASPDASVFSKVYVDSSLDLVVFCHNETGVLYLWRKVGYAGGLTIMVDADGKPLIYTPED